MKKLGIVNVELGIIIFLFLIINVYSQDFEPAQQKFRIGGQTAPLIYLSGDSTYFKQNNFILGWAWSCGRTMSEALFDNQGHVGNGFSKSVIKNNTNLIICANGIYDAGGGETGSNSQSTCFSPVLRITNESGIINNPKHYIFGFKHIDGETIGSNDVSLKLRTTGSYISSTVPVLDSAWSNNFLYWYDPNGTNSWEPDINTERMFFVINLKRNNPNDNSQDNTPVLKIKLPYQINGVSNYIQFDSLPSSNPNDTFHIRTTINNAYRGIARKWGWQSPGTREFYITRNMLPRDTGNITILAHFGCDNTISHNPKLDINNNGDTIGIQVFYLGNADVNINHLYFATNNAKKLYFGYFDLTIKNAVQDNLNYYTDTSFSNNGIKPFRFNTRDEIGPAYFGAQRYINKLIGNVTTSQSGFPLPNHYYYYTNAPDEWVETHKVWNIWAMPSFKNWFNYNIYSLGLTSGYSSIWGHQVDTLNSGYETYLLNYTSLKYMDTCSFQAYSDIFTDWYSYFRSFQAGYEWFEMAPRFLNQNVVPLYSDKFWWGESFCGSNNGFVKVYEPPDSVMRLVNSIIRPKTGEEMRLCSNIDIILGCKGLLYDREQSDCPDYWFGMGYGQNWYDSLRLDTMSISNFIYSDLVGRDFINQNGDYHFLERYVNFDSSAKVMGVKKDRLYLGRKSPRTETYKIHRWILAVDSTLMSLRLVCWYIKHQKE